MRVTDSLLLNGLTANVQTSSSNFELLQQELSTGRRINQPSDDPAGTEQALTLQATLDGITQQQRDVTSATSFLNYTDSQLNSVNTLAQQARTIAVAAASGGTQSPGSLQAYATQVDSIITQLVTLANSSLGGRYIFSGTQTKTPPYQQNDPTHAYSGDTGSVTATLGNNTTIALNTPGNQVFTPLLTELETLKTNITAGNSSTISNNDLHALDSAAATISQAQATVGAATNQVTDVSTRLGRAQIDTTNTLSSLEDADLATVYTNLQVAQNVYQASLVATQGAFKYSLADYIH